VLVKICGLTRRDDAWTAARAGATFGGVILAPARRRTVSADEADAIFDGVPLRRVGVFVDPPLDEALRVAERLRLDVVQLHGKEPPEAAASMRGAGHAVWKAVRVGTAADLAAAADRFAEQVDGLLLDGGAGGTGERFDWEEVAAGRGAIPHGLRLIVAGGLSPRNVREAIRHLRPDVVDVSSGVEATSGAKDPHIVRAFVAAARGTHPISAEHA
jgi:phosphoribosylanthranilate isomerase